MKTIAPVVLLALLAATTGATVTIETVPVSNPGNAPDTEVMTDGTSGYGSVDYVYHIGKYEITASQYTEFLNAVAKDDPNGLFNPLMNYDADPDPVASGANIKRSGSSPNFSYSVAIDWADRPVNYVSFWDAARFANWLHNGQPTGPQGPGTTEDGAYHDIGNQTLFGRSAGARFFIPTEDEWYKAAYHDKTDRLAANYFDYPTGSNAVPGNDITEMSSPGNNANYAIVGSDYVDYVIGSPYYRTVGGEFESSASPYGTFDQGGNIWEWNETMVSSSTRGLRGGAFIGDPGLLHAFFRSRLATGFELGGVGFRVASIVPEPSTLLLAALAAAALFPRRKRRA